MLSSLKESGRGGTASVWGLIGLDSFKKISECWKGWFFCILNYKKIKIETALNAVTLISYLLTLYNIYSDVRLTGLCKRLIFTKNKLKKVLLMCLPATKINTAPTNLSISVSLKLIVQLSRLDLKLKIIYIANIHLFKVNNKKTGESCEIYSTLTTKTP